MSFNVSTLTHARQFSSLAVIRYFASQPMMRGIARLLLRRMHYNEECLSRIVRSESEVIQDALRSLIHRFMITSRLSYPAWCISRFFLQVI